MTYHLLREVYTGSALTKTDKRERIGEKVDKRLMAIVERNISNVLIILRLPVLPQNKTYLKILVNKVRYLPDSG